MSEPERLRIRDASDWRREVATLDDSVRKRIVNAVFAGRALEDPEEAAIAIGCALGWKRRAWLGLALLPVVFGVAIFADPVEGRSPAAVVTSAWSIVVFGVCTMSTFWARSRARRALALNRSVVEEALAGIRPAPPAKGTVADALKAWRTHAGLKPRGPRKS
jgi:hypothetical protein